eukprot:4931249-Alexandrium_andersonii.AAC.1
MYMNGTDAYAGTIPPWTAGGDRVWSSPLAPASAAPRVSCTRAGGATSSRGASTCSTPTSRWASSEVP